MFVRIAIIYFPTWTTKQDMDVAIVIRVGIGNYKYYYCDLHHKMSIITNYNYNMNTF